MASLSMSWGGVVHRQHHILYHTSTTVVLLNSCGFHHTLVSVPDCMRHAAHTTRCSGDVVGVWGAVTGWCHCLTRGMEVDAVRCCMWSTKLRRDIYAHAAGNMGMFTVPYYHYHTSLK